MKKEKLFAITIGIVAIFSFSTLTLSFKVEKKWKNTDDDRVKVEEITGMKKRLSLIMVGDCLIHGSIYADAKEEDETYNFYKMVDLIKPIIQKYDLAFYNQESILGGTELGLSTYPSFNSPQEVGDAMIDAGFNLVSLANNHTLDRGKRAIYSSLAYWKTKEDVITAGSYSSEEERVSLKIGEKNGITYALLSYTTTTNGIPRPSLEPYLVTTYDEKTVKEDVERLRGKVDLLMVSMHWGEEYTHIPTEEQRRIAKHLATLGVDIVIGHHPHVIQPIEFIGDTMVVYSLGNFISSQYGTDKLTGLMASVTVTKTTKGDQSDIKLEYPTAELIYTSSKITGYRSDYRLYPYTKLNDQILNNYQAYYQKYSDIVTSMSDRVIMIGFFNSQILKNRH